MNVTFSSIDRNPTITITPADRAAILAPYSGRTWADWTPEERRAWIAANPEPEPRPTYHAPAPTFEDAVWFSGFEAGFDGIDCDPPTGLDASERNQFEIGYQAGCAARWKDYGDFEVEREEAIEWDSRLEDMHDSMRETEDLEMMEREARWAWGCSRDF